MKLPVIKATEYEITLPLSKKKLTFRPYSVGDEKILLAAATSKNSDPGFYIKNTIKVLKGCITDDTDLDLLAALDVEYLFVQLRGKSAGEEIQFHREDPETKKKTEYLIQTDKFRLKEDPEHEYKIQLTDTVGLKMKDLTFRDKILYSSKYTEANQTEAIYDTIIDSVESIFDENNVWVVGTDITKEETKAFILPLTGVSHKLYKFIGTMPKLVVDAFEVGTGTIKELSGSEIDFLPSP